MQEITEKWDLATRREKDPLRSFLSTLSNKTKRILARGQSGFGVRRGEGHPAGTIELRLEGRWLRLWGLLGREVSLDEGELSLLSLRAVGPQSSDPFGPWDTRISLPCAGGAAGEKAWHRKPARIRDKGMDEMRAL